MSNIHYTYLNRSNSKYFLGCLWSLVCYMLLLFSTAVANTTNAALQFTANGDSSAIPSKRVNDNSFSEVSARFVTEAIDLKIKERFITNAIVVKNNKSVAVHFTMELVFPASWKLIGNTDKLYEIDANDSLVIPVRIIPGLSTADGVLINIQALLVSEDQNLLGDASFIVKRKKDIRWSVKSESGDRIYFPVNDSVVPFSISVNNDGNEKIDLLLSRKQLGNKIQVKDESPDLQHSGYHELMLEPEADTVINFSAALQTQIINSQRVDIENYSFSAINEEVRNTLFFQSQLSNTADGKVFSGSRRMDFIRLSDNKVINPYGSAIIPLTMDANMYNIIGTQPIMRMELRGSTLLSNQGLLSYQTLFNFTSYKYSQDLTNDMFYRVSYSQKHGDIQVGNISGGLSLIPISGRGISGNYFITPSLRAGAYFVKNSFNKLEDNSYAYGGYLRYQLRRIGTSTVQYGRSSFEKNSRENSYISVNNSIKILPNQQINFGYALSTNNFLDSGFVKAGHSISAGYSGSYLHKKIFTNIRGSLFSADYGARGLPSSNYFHRSGFNAGNKWSLIMQNSYSTYDQYSILNNTSDIVKNKVNYNQLFFNLNAKGSRIVPSLFYNVTELNMLKLIYRGAGFDYSKSSYTGRSRVGLSLLGGYNKLPDYKDIGDYFSLQLSVAAQHKTMSFNSRYYYGPQYISDPAVLRNSFKYPQSIFLSMSKQWLPRNRSLVFQANGNYSYMNQFNRHTFGIFPEAYYFTKSRWRFKISTGYSLGTSKIERAVQSYQGEAMVDDGPKKVFTQNFFLNAGVRKEFGIPVPKKWTKKAFANVNFITFLDANGNHIKDKNEVVIKNIVIRLGNDEVISNEDGVAGFTNIAAGKYAFKVMSLYELNGWYPLIEDSLVTGFNQDINVPFVKGIKLTGNVVLQKERYSGVTSSIDLSRILITAVDSSGKEYQSLTDKNGNYILYLPPGHYFLSMDEGIVGKGFIVLKNNAELHLSEVESYNYNFYILEKKRKINIKKFGE